MKSSQLKLLKPNIFTSDRTSAWFSLKNPQLVHDSSKIAGLNLGLNTDEKSEIIFKNREALGKQINTPIHKIAFANQIHSNEILEVSEGGIYDNLDGFISNTKGIALAIQVADCAAVLLADEINGVIGAAHAGWKGAVNAIVSNTVSKMCKIGADSENIKAFISPCISLANFEVGEEVAEKFPERFVHRLGFEKPHVDLKNYVKEELLNNGILIQNIEMNTECTIEREDKFYSYRRESSKSGRMMGIIKLNN